MAVPLFIFKSERRNKISSYNKLYTIVHKRCKSKNVTESRDAKKTLPRHECGYFT